MNKVSVVIPTYKRYHILSRAINCVLLQTYKDVEIIVVDDNNENDEFRKKTEILMEQYKDNSRIKYIKHSKNKNGAAARNTGIKASDADFIAFLDDDDLWSRKKIEKQIEYLNFKGNSYAGVSCSHIHRYKNFTYKAVQFNENENGNYFFELFTNRKSTPTSTLLFRKEVFEKIMFDESFFRHQDIEFLANFYRFFKMGICPHFLVSMQVDGERNNPSKNKASLIKQKLLEKYKDDILQMPVPAQKRIYNCQNAELSKMKYHNNIFYLFTRKLFAVILGLTIYRRFMDMEKYWGDD